jgi:ribonuclease BN (tRNA processing enzyme)
MKLTFWGVRGSIPAPITPREYREKINEILRRAVRAKLAKVRDIDPFVARLPFHLGEVCGGNTACVSIEEGETVIILDCGSGVKELGNYLLTRPAKEYHIFLSHLHWDHTIGLPFFTPIYIPGRKLHFYSFQPELSRIITALFTAPAFPVDFSVVARQVEFHHVALTDSVRVDDLTITFSPACHPNGCMNIKVADRRGKTVVYATDSEYKELDSDSTRVAIDFFRGADALIFDAQYSFADAYSSKLEWGHSTAIVGIDLAAEAQVRRLLLFHHDPYSRDSTMAEILAKSSRYRTVQGIKGLKIDIAREGMELLLG